MADQDTPFLAIKNWAKYQTTTRRNAPWIKDDTMKDLDDRYSQLTMPQRYIMDGCCRLRGRTGKNLANDPLWICRALAVRPQERHNAITAIAQLITSGFLVPTNQQLDYDKVPSETEGETEKETEGEKSKPSPRKARSQKAHKADQRFPEFVDVLHRYHGKFVGEALKFELWFGRRGGTQLNHLLKAEPDLDMKTFERAIAVRARSPSTKHHQPVFEWVFHVIGGQKAATNGKSTAEQRIERNNEKYARIEQRITGVPETPGTGLSLGTGGRGNSLVAGEPELLPPARDQTGRGRAGPEST